MNKTYKYIILANMIMVMLPNIIFACEKCFGAKTNTPVTQGIGFAMLLLLIVTAVVLGAIVSFAVYMARRIRMVESGQIVVTEQGNLITHPGLLSKIKDFNDKGV